VCFGHSIDDKFDVQGNTIDNLMRYMDIKSYYGGMNDILEFMRAYPEVNFRYYIQPSTALPILKILDANNQTSTYPMQMQGRLDGENAVKAGEGAMFEKIREFNGTSIELPDFVTRAVKDQAEYFKQQRRHQDEDPFF